MAYLLGCENVQLEYPTARLFDSLTLGVNSGDRIGIVGRNGDGKSTLLKLLAGVAEPDGGRVVRTGNVTVGMLAQRDSLDDGDTVGHAIVGDRPEYEWAGDARVRAILSELVCVTTGRSTLLLLILSSSNTMNRLPVRSSSLSEFSRKS